jgi:hypothetical protein
MSKWISVKDELPPLDLPVWILLPDTGEPVVGARSDDGNGWKWGLCYGDFYWDRDERVWKICTYYFNVEGGVYHPTHWQYLPQPPEVEP